VSYIEHHKRLTDAVAALGFVTTDSPEVVALREFDDSCRPQLLALVEAANRWGWTAITKDGVVTNRLLADAICALDARADEVAGGGDAA
jgi:hypothetical protein